MIRPKSLGRHKFLTRAQQIARAERAINLDLERIDGQRAVFVAVPDSPAKRDLEAAMLARARVLLDDGQAEACDALLEFLPEKIARQMLDEWFDDQFPDRPPSR